MHRVFHEIDVRRLVVFKKKSHSKNSKFHPVRAELKSFETFEFRPFSCLFEFVFLSTQRVSRKHKFVAPQDSQRVFLSMFNFSQAKQRLDELFLIRVRGLNYG